MTGKRKFTVAMTFLILAFGTLIFSLQSGVEYDGSNMGLMYLYIMVGTSVLAGTMALENIVKEGGLGVLFGRKNKEDK